MHDEGAPSMAFFYEIRSTTDNILKRTSGFRDREAAKLAARADAKKMKNSRLPNRSDVGKILVGQNSER
jgi:hypothetical protein